MERQRWREWELHEIKCCLTRLLSHFSLSCPIIREEMSFMIKSPFMIKRIKSTLKYTIGITIGAIFSIDIGAYVNWGGINILLQGIYHD